jgi:hypothetical protein
MMLVVLERVIAKCVAGASIADVCAFGDSEILGEVTIHLRCCSSKKSTTRRESRRE